MSAILSPDDAQRMQAVLAAVESTLGRGEAEWLAMRLRGQAEIRASLRVERDRVICQALRLLAALPPTQAAERLSRMLDERLRNFGEVTCRPGTLAELVDRIARLNDFKPLTGRRIHAIATGN